MVSVGITAATKKIHRSGGSTWTRRLNGALPDVAAKTIALSKVELWKRAEEFPTEFVTLPGETSPSSALVKACYALLVPKSAALQ